MSEIIEQYFIFVLSSLGYPVGDIRWSLGYCQGDGMRFTGMVDVRIVARRLLAGNPVFMGLALSAIEKGDRIEITAKDSRYVHAYTMSADRCWDTQLTLAEDKAMGLLLSLIEEDIVKVSLALEQDGYACLGSGPYENEVVLDRTFGSFGLQVLIQQEDSHCLPDSGERLYDLVDMVDMAKGRTGVVSIEVKIEHDAREVAAAHLGGYDFKCDWNDLGKEPGFRGYVRELLSDACEQARRTIGMEKQGRQTSLALA